LASQIDAGLVEFISSDGRTHNEQHSGTGTYMDRFGASTEFVRDRFIKPVFDCDKIIAVLDTPDSYGTIAEIAFGGGIGKVAMVIIYLKPDQDYVINMLDAYWFVLSLPTVFPVLVADDEEALRTLNNFLKIESPIEWRFYWATYAIRTQHFYELEAQATFQADSFKYRVDFLYRGEKKTVAIELDGHEGHKTKEQRTHDARKDRFLKQQGIDVIRFTGTEITHDIDRCVREFVALVE
jgi:very-short-patch-repair endonuclease